MGFRRYPYPQMMYRRDLSNYIIFQNIAQIFSRTCVVASCHRAANELLFKTFHDSFDPLQDLSLFFRSDVLFLDDPDQVMEHRRVMNV